MNPQDPTPKEPSPVKPSHHGKTREQLQKEVAILKIQAKQEVENFRPIKACVHPSPHVTPNGEIDKAEEVGSEMRFEEVSPRERHLIMMDEIFLKTPELRDRYCNDGRFNHEVKQAALIGWEFFKLQDAHYIPQIKALKEEVEEKDREIDRLKNHNEQLKWANDESVWKNGFEKLLKEKQEEIERLKEMVGASEKVVEALIAYIPLVVNNQTELADKQFDQLVDTMIHLAPSPEKENKV